MNTHTERAIRRCLSWIEHSGLTDAEMAERAGIAASTLRRFKRGQGVTVRAVQCIERSVPKNWRHPLPDEREVA
jgi:predicted transcriptional regulator